LRDCSPCCCRDTGPTIQAFLNQKWLRYSEKHPWSTETGKFGIYLSVETLGARVFCRHGVIQWTIQTKVWDWVIKLSIMFQSQLCIAEPETFASGRWLS
jgi:hypothetical protein